MKNSNAIDIFISHTSEDQEVADKLISLLQDHDITFWEYKRSQGAQGSGYERYERPMVELIGACKAFLLIYSKHCVNSIDVDSEVKVAWRDQKERILVNIGNTPLEGQFEYHLAGVDWITVEHEIDFGISSKILAKIQGALGKVPHPPYYSPNTLSSISAYSRTAMFPFIPFNLGTTLGLDRGSYIALVSGVDSRQALATLSDSENLFFGLAAHSSPKDSLPTRWWFGCNWQKLPHGPLIEAQLWENVYTEPEGHLHWVRARGLQEAIVGLVLEIDSAVHEKPSTEVILEWCDSVFKRLFPNQSTAIIISFGRTKTPVIEAQIRDLVKSIHKRLPQIRIDNFDASQTDYWNNGYSLNVSHREPGDVLSPGSHLVYWLKLAIPHFPSYAPWDKFAGTIDDLLQLYDSYRENLSSPASSCESDLITDLVRLENPKTNKLVTQLLRLLQYSLPNSLPSVIAACAISKNPVVRRAALVFSKKSDELMDAWVSATGLAIELLPKDLDLMADPHSGPFIDELTTAILRYGNRTHNIEVACLLIEQTLMPYLTPSGEAVLGLISGKISQEQFLKNYGGPEYALAVKAGFEFDPLLTAGMCTTLDAIGPDIWWLISALPPTTPLVEAILRLDAKSRSIFGLITQSEWQTLRASPYTLEYVDVRSRRKRQTFDKNAG